MVIGESIIVKIVDIIINPLILLIFATGMVVFMWGLVQFMWGLEESGARETGKRHMLWGVVGMFIMVGVGGILELTLDTFDITVDQTPLGNGIQNARNAVDPFRPR